MSNAGTHRRASVAQRLLRSWRHSSWSATTVRRTLVGFLAGLIVATIGLLGFEKTFDDRTESQAIATSTSPPSPDHIEDTLPAAATRGGRLATIATGNSQFELSGVIHRLARNADRDELERLLEDVSQLRPVASLKSATSILYLRYAELDPVAAVDHLLSRQHYFEDEWLMLVFQTWAQIDIDQAIDNARLLSSSAKQLAIISILNTRGDLPPDRRQSLGAETGMWQFARYAGVDESLVYGNVQFDALWSTALEVEDPIARSRKMRQLSQAWGRRDPRAALAAIEETELKSMRGSILRNWAERDPLDASFWVMEQAESYQRSVLVGQLVNGWAKSDPTAAMDFARSLAGREQRRGYEAAVLGWAGSDPRAAANWLTNQNEVTLTASVYSRTAQQYAQQDAEDAYQWALNLPSEHARVAIGPALNHLIQQEPPRYARRIDSIEDPAVRAVAEEHLAARWGGRDPVAATRWLELQGAEQQRRLYPKMMQSWASADAEAAERHLATIEDKAARDRAAAGMIQTLFRDTERAERLFEGISNEQARRQAARSLYNRWLRSDPAYAEKFKAAAGIGNR